MPGLLLDTISFISCVTTIEENGHFQLLLTVHPTMFVLNKCVIYFRFVFTSSLYSVLHSDCLLSPAQFSDEAGHSDHFASTLLSPTAGVDGVVSPSRSHSVDKGQVPPPADDDDGPSSSLFLLPPPPAVLKKSLVLHLVAPPG